MSTPLADPRLSAFFASNPSVLAAPDPMDGQTAIVPISAPVPPKREVPAVELAAAFLVVAGLVARHLAHAEPDPEPRQAAKSAWARYAPLWLRLAVPAITHAYRLGRVQGLSAAELAVMAADYATSLGDYISDSSADALADGLGQQLAAKWSEKVAWQRATVAYGLDGAAMHAHIAGLLRGSEAGQTDTIPPLARSFVDKLLIRRADRLGQTESWRAQQSGKVIAWLYLLRAGQLPADARKVWRTREDEATCPVCGPLDKVAVPLDEPWETNEGVRLWAPSAHPGCRCEAELQVPDDGPAGPVSKARGNDPYNRDAHGEFARQESRQARTARPEVTERERPSEDIVERLRRNVVPDAPADPFAIGASDPFATATSLAGSVDPFAVDPFAGGGGGADPFAADPFGAESEAQKKRAASKQKLGRGETRLPNRLLILLRSRGAAGYPGSKEDPYALVVRDFKNSFEEADEWDWFYEAGEVVDFDAAQESARYQRAFERSYNGRGWDNPDPNEGEPFDPEDPRGPKFAAPAEAVKTQWTLRPEEEYFVDGDAWEENQYLIRSVRNAALLEADSIVEHLTNRDFRDIYIEAGRNLPAGSENVRRDIMEAVRDEASSEGLAAAYADHVLFNRPELTGADGENLARVWQSMRDEDYFPFASRQVFRFENGFQPNTEIKNGFAHLHGHYVVTHVEYESNVGQGMQTERPGVQGYRYVYLSPISRGEAMGHTPDEDDPPFR